MARLTSRIMRLPSCFDGSWIPGLSTKTICPRASLSTPWIASRVVWARRLVIETLLPTKALSKVDLPTLGLPRIVTNPALVMLGSDIGY